MNRSGIYSVFFFLLYSACLFGANIVSVNPNHGPGSGGTVVEIIGSGFTGDLSSYNCK